jgi:hypothetical protein
LVELDRGDRVIPGRVLRRIHLAGIIRKTVYQSLVNLFEANGYRSGDLAAPQAGGNFFLFSYDWRQDNVESAQLLGRRLEALRRTHGNARLPVVLICQSNGAHLCRYFVKYGSAPLEVAESGQATAAPKIDVQKVVLAGASNGGSLRILRELNRGRKYIRWIGRRWSPETLFTFVSLYQDLPAYTQDLFVDAHGKPLAIDLYDASAWVKHGWSIYGRAAAGRLRGRTTPELFGSAQRRRDFLRLALDRAKRFQRVLHRDVEGFGPTRFYLIENDFNETPARAMLLRNGGGWQTYFSGDRELAKCPAAAAAANAPGDGHATLVSQRALRDDSQPGDAATTDRDRGGTEREFKPRKRWSLRLHPRWRNRYHRRRCGAPYARPLPARRRTSPPAA